MSYEVELKFAVTETAALLETLTEWDAVRHEPMIQRDTYYAHPQRDFAQTDEAFRLRSIGDENRITYKGPLVDRETKTRKEIELTYADGAAAASQFAEMLVHLSFRPVRTVEKVRTAFEFTWEECPIELVFDDVTGLGQFVELEAAADEETLDEVRAKLLRLAETLKLTNPIRNSYLGLLIEKESAE